ncbi:MAG: hypothetical protein NZ553_06160 [Caldilinea sp.]|nr:hypothetical protein [Caldilinea sp.]MDW8440040.1 hypothetical protein [Caldilineaceae bacterium]
MGAFLRTLLSAALTALALPFYLRWAGDQAEAQIDKMQRAVHFTPGAEAPVPAEVAAGALGLCVGHFVVARALRLGWPAAFCSLLLGVAIGLFVFIYQMLGEEEL